MLDIFIIIMIFMNILWGFKKGFVLSLMSFGSYIVAVIAAKIYYLKLSEWIQKTTSIDLAIKNFIGNNFDGLISLWIPKELPEEGSNPLVGFLKDYLIKETSILTHTESAAAIKNDLSNSITIFIINIISIILIFILVRLTVIFISQIIDNAFKLPILNTMNRLGGAMVGAIRGILIILIVLIIILPITLKNPYGKMAMAIDESILLQSFLENWLVSFLNWLL
ncbi:CvpA family protein [Alkaliphilus serpentinus]|uniref:Colicin V production protein n=1 Tax=Alkaliphilus serpentinus TaxID=1482731 RepID=A0A833HQY0_9FIRM|nr:CvpA family protein [Alkaliphilus serpentinus]KAB3532205.1 hypothetical protein F8153_02830 [Alkaliphilus serpentinus]